MWCQLPSGVATQILSEELRATYTHCYGHALNHAASDTVKMNRILRDTLDTALEISKLLKYSPRRDAIFARLKTDIAPATPGFRTTSHVSNTLDCACCFVAEYNR